LKAGEALTFGEARTANEILKARQADIKLDELEGRLIPAADVQALREAEGIGLRDRLRAIPMVVTERLLDAAKQGARAPRWWPECCSRKSTPRSRMQAPRRWSLRPPPEPPPLDDEALAALTRAARLAGDVGLLPRLAEGDRAGEDRGLGDDGPLDAVAIYRRRSSADRDRGDRRGGIGGCRRRAADGTGRAGRG
jgi:hypothetical protein